MFASVLQERSHEIARLLRSEDGKYFLAWINEQIQCHTSQLKGLSEPITIGRSQGRLEILDKLLTMREE